MSARHSITIATAGHVDHGKTSLVSRITGTDTDTLAEEKTRGLSINLGFAYHHVPGAGIDDRTVGFVDVPGHTDFINNALAGIGAADMALLVVAADDGVMPQTREHLAIIDLLAIDTGAVVITKIDMVEPDRVDVVRAQVQGLVSGTAFAAVPVFAVSSHTGSGFDTLTSFLEAKLQQQVENLRSGQQWCRLSVDRSFPIKGIGTVVTGTVLAGQIATDQTLTHSGSGESVRIKGLRHDNDQVTHASAGERVAVNVPLGHRQIARGDWLLAEPLYRPVFRLDVRVRLLAAMEFNSSSLYHLYHGTGHHLVRVRRLGEDSPYYQINAVEPLYALQGDRFILRDPACQHTIGGGTIVDTWVPHRGRSGSQRLEELSILEQDDFQALKGLLEKRPAGVEMQRFAVGRNCNPERIRALKNSLSEAGVDTVELTLDRHHLPLLMYRGHFDPFTAEILDRLQRFHELNSDQLGPSEPALNRLTGFTHSHLLFHALVNHLVDTAQVMRTGTLLHMPGHVVKLSNDEKAFLGRIRPLLNEAGFLAPRTREIAEMTGMKLGTLERTLARARKAGSLIRVASNRYYLPETMMELAAFTESLAEDTEAGFTVIEFRDRLGIGRNLCIEILEYFDSIGFTRRDGNNRFLRTDKENLFSHPST